MTGTDTQERYTRPQPRAGPSSLSGQTCSLICLVFFMVETPAIRALSPNVLLLLKVEPRRENQAQVQIIDGDLDACAEIQHVQEATKNGVPVVIKVFEILSICWMGHEDPFAHLAMTDTTTAKIKVTVYAYVMPPVELEIDHANAKADAIMTQISNDLLDRLDSEPIGGHGPMNDESLIYPACEWMMCLCGEQRTVE
ncbi:hypothetical protein CC1G_11839 [Coprinopsis cinerea okayama7|uniref:Uncharacterized protein n=1 Tax=Coprinopsis cinerea (strain Okayama-7 / 130 / ATCC MYA-4618 / FGSC 9003) TaxID=240176 RepID=A8PH01_COPC7|nr:hypothetical protein CC1G_11839 [Coprinopsis cinerea okayama7\|eukprot:XP_001841311.2 hypothetical protein CC1G_11839 [Coprinopsis cinerea okayama7\